jgi:hypothetical protein
VADYFARRKPKANPPLELEQAMALAAITHSKNGHEESGIEKLEASRWVTEGRGHLLR